MLPMLFGIMAIGLGASLIAREEQQDTIELVLSRPISRTSFLAGKALAGLLIIIFTGLVTATITAIGIRAFGFETVSMTNAALACAVSILLSVLFGMVSFTLTAMGHGARLASVGIASLFALGGYVISSLDETVRWLRFPAKLFPYHYYHPSDILSGQFTPNEVIGMAAAIAILGVISWIAFRRRDLD
jgi:ABC-2 type transport system permease protein